MEIILIRHAESEYNTKESRHLDSPITKNGRRQAIELSAFLKRKFDDISDWRGYVSPLLRTLQTAKIIHEHTEMRFDVEYRLVEYNNGSSGYPYNFILDIPVRRDWFADFFRKVPPDQKFWRQEAEEEQILINRLTGYLNFLKSEHPNDKIILVSHAMPIYTMIYLLKDIAIVPKWDRKILNTSVTWFTNVENQPKCRYFARFVNSGRDPRPDGPVVPFI